MLKYSITAKQTLADFMNRTNVPTDSHPASILDPKHLPTRPTNIAISKKNKADRQFEPPFTPKTARATYDYPSASNNSYNRSSHVTPEKEPIKKDTSFNTPLKSKKQDYLDSLTQHEHLPSKDELKGNSTDRSQRILKTNVLKDATNKQNETKSILRQTVSNASIWQLKNMMPPSPIKTNNELKKDTSKTQKEEGYFRKKIQSEFTSTYTETCNSKQPTKKIIKTHSRANSNADTEFKPIEALNFKNKIYPSASTRVSQDLTHSANLNRNKVMSQTDPNGNCYQQIPAAKRLSGMLSARREQGELRIDDFALGSCKGEGRFGKVFPAVHRKSGWLVAIKQIKKQDLRLMVDQFVQQIKINLFANHPNVVKMYGFFHDQTSIYILMEYMEEGSLYKSIKISKKLKDEQASQKLYEICDAVNYLHANDILHRDIKPQNIVLTNGVCKLCDFGWATYSKERRNTYCGTLDYVCPEILEGQSYDNFVDIWAIGVLAYEMLTGKAPFYHISRKETMKSILNCQFTFPPEVSVNAKLFIKKALQKLPDKRFTIESLLHDRYLSACNPRG